jgi:DNA polymerase phi
MKGTDERDGLFARLFGLLALIESGCLFASLQQNKSAKEGAEVVGRVMACLVELGGKKGWLRESAWWGVLKALEGAIALPEGEGRKMALEKVYEVVRAEGVFSQEKLALVLLLEKEGLVSCSHPNDAA